MKWTLFQANFCDWLLKNFLWCDMNTTGVPVCCSKLCVQPSNMLQDRIKFNTSTCVISILNCQQGSTYSERERGLCGFSFWDVAISNVEGFPMFWLPTGYRPSPMSIQSQLNPPTLRVMSFKTAAKTTCSH